MTTQYIVKVSSRNHENVNFSKTKDGFVELVKPEKLFNKIPRINIRSHEDSNIKMNVTWFDRFITNNNMDVDFNESDKECTFIFNDSLFNKNNKSEMRIKFDGQSASCFTDFKKSLDEILNSKFQSVNYDNGRLMYTGDVVEKKESKKLHPHGEGSLYYNSLVQKVKYSGEFENGFFDGAGTFHSKDGNFMITANNISRGIPTQKGKLLINFTDFKDSKVIDFNQLWDKLKLYDRERKMSFVRSNDFVSMVAKLLMEETNLNTDELVFGDKSAKDQRIEIWRKLKELNSTLDKTSRKYDTVLDNHFRTNVQLMMLGSLINLTFFCMLFFSRN